MNRTILKVSLHPDDCNPVFGDRAIHIEVLDEAAGPFLKITQNTEEQGRFDFNELEEILKEAKVLIENFNDKT